MNATSKTETESPPRAGEACAGHLEMPSEISPDEQDYGKLHAELSKRIDWLRRKAKLYIGKT